MKSANFFIHVAFATTVFINASMAQAPEDAAIKDPALRAAVAAIDGLPAQTEMYLNGYPETGKLKETARALIQQGQVGDVAYVIARYPYEKHSWQALGDLVGGPVGYPFAKEDLSRVEQLFEAAIRREWGETDEGKSGLVSPMVVRIGLAQNLVKLTSGAEKIPDYELLVRAPSEWLARSYPGRKESADSPSSVNQGGSKTDAGSGAHLISTQHDVNNPAKAVDERSQIVLAASILVGGLVICISAFWFLSGRGRRSKQ